MPIIAIIIALAIMMNADKIDKRLSQKFHSFRRRRYKRKLYEFKDKFGYSPYFVQMQKYLQGIGETYLLEK